MNIDFIPGIQHLGLFIITGLLVNMVPGPDTLYILGRTVAQGRRTGVLSALGISAGCFVHTIAAALGLSAVLVTSAKAFMVVKLCGAAYLIYLGLQMLIHSSRKEGSGERDLAPVRGRTVFAQAVLTNVLNPKVALFFLAFLPQFVSSTTQQTILPFLFLGLVFVVNGTIYCLLLVLFASTLARKFKASQRTATLLKRVTGGLFVGLGLKLALER